MNSNTYTHRKSEIRLRLCGGDGTPLANQPVRISQTRHAFLFGCGGFDAVELAGGNPDGSPLDEVHRTLLQERLDKIFALNNYATLPFYWGRYEPEEGKSDKRRLIAAAKWFSERGVTVKGHPLCWHTVCADWLMKYDNRTILEKQLARIRREVEDFEGLVDMWDVINEVVIMPEFNKYDNAITRVCKEIGRVNIIREVFAAARNTSPKAVLLLNDFNVSPKYEQLIEECLDAGVKIDVIGIQSHQHKGYWGREKLEDVLARFSRFDLPLHFTENTLISGDIMPAHIEDLNDWQVPEWPTTPEGEERQAKQAAEMYEILFSHPKVEAITTWDPNDGKWLGAPSGFLRKDNSEKPIYNTMMKKIKGEWWTDETLATDLNGEVSIYGFRGDYKVCTEGKTAAFTLNEGNGVLTLKLEEMPAQ